MEKVKSFWRHHQKLYIISTVFIVGMAVFPFKIRAQEIGPPVVEDLSNTVVSENRVENEEGSLPLILLLIFMLFIVLAVIQYWGHKVIE